MELVVDASVEEKALSAKEWISQSSASQHRHHQLSMSSMEKSASRSRDGVVPPERSNDGILFSGMNLAHAGSVEVVLQALDVPMQNDSEESDDRVRPLSSTTPALITSRSSRTSSINLSQAHLCSLEVDSGALDMPMCNINEKMEDGIAPLSSTISTLIKSQSSRRSSSNFPGKGSAYLVPLEAYLQELDMPMCTSNGKREGGIPPLTPTCSPVIKSKSSKSSRNQSKKDDGIPPLTSTCSPLITSKSSKSSSNQGSLPGLVVAPDGVTLVKDRRKCKPRGVLTVGLETSSTSSDGEVALPNMPSVATVEWVDESWNDTLSPFQSHLDELNNSCSSVTSKSMRSPRVALNFGFHEENTKKLRVGDVSPNIREVMELRPEIGSIMEEPHEVKESVEGRPADVILADGDVSFRPGLDPELPPSGKDYSVSASSNNHQEEGVTSAQEVNSRQKQMGFSDLEQHDHAVDTRQSLQMEVVSPQKQMGFCDLEHHHHLFDMRQSLQMEISSPQKQMVFSALDDHHQSLDMRQSLQLELRDDVNIFRPIEVYERPCDYGSDMILQDHSETGFLTVKNDEKLPENRSSGEGSFCPLSVSPTPLESPGNEGASSSAVVPLGSLTDSGYNRGLSILSHKHEEQLGIRSSELSQGLHSIDNQLSPEELVAETLYQLAAENLRKTRTGARRLTSLEEKQSKLEAGSLLSIVKQSASSVDTSTSGEYTTRTDVVPYVLTSSISGQVSSGPELAKMDFAPPLRTIVLNGESDFSQELTTLKALIGNVHVEAYDSGLRGIPATIRGVYEEVESPDQSSLALSRRPQRQYRGLRSNYCSNDSKSSFRKGKLQQQRRLSSSCGKRVGFGSILAATATLGIVVVSLAMGSCQHCYRSNQYQYYIQPT
ncbi:unnamed protein product [Calypogeia fissa]